jgi:hypothetical protein
MIPVRMIITRINTSSSIMACEIAFVTLDDAAEFTARIFSRTIPSCAPD